MVNDISAIEVKNDSSSGKGCKLNSKHCNCHNNLFSFPELSQNRPETINTKKLLRFKKSKENT